MISSTEAWRERILEWVPESAIPSRPGLGERYPWRRLVVHSRSTEHRRRVDSARRLLGELPDLDPVSLGWYLAISGGKDSVATAILLAQLGMRMPAMCALRPSVDYPSKDVYVDRVCRALGHEPHLLYPKRGDDALGELLDLGVRLTDDPGVIGKAMVDAGLWGNVGDWLAEWDYAGVFLGLRSRESRGRTLNRATHGRVYLRKDGMTVCTPIADWTAEDVHAFALANDVPLLPLYLCVDPGDDGMKLREDTVLSGGTAARYGAYAWLRRWFPSAWDRIVDADPEVRTLS